MGHKTLLLQNEIGKGYRYGKDLQSCNIDEILMVERREFRECLGIDFYKYLKAHLVDYSDAKAWNPNDTYNEGDIVKLKNCFWIACYQKDEDGFIIFDNPTPLGEPGMSDYWKEGQKFTESCLNDLWCEGFLWKYIDLMVQIQVGSKHSMPLTARGWRKGFDKDSESLSPKDIAIRIKMLKDEAAEILTQLDEWVVENQACGCYDLYKNLDKMACKKCGCEKLHSCKCAGSQDCITKKKNHRLIGFA